MAGQKDQSKPSVDRGPLPFNRATGFWTLGICHIVLARPPAPQPVARVRSAYPSIQTNRQSFNTLGKTPAASRYTCPPPPAWLLSRAERHRAVDITMEDHRVPSTIFCLRRPLPPTRPDTRDRLRAGPAGLHRAQPFGKDGRPGAVHPAPPRQPDRPLFLR